MAEINLCRLCVNPCSGLQSLYNSNGIGNWIYQMTVKYFHTLFSSSSVKTETQLSNICSQCWRYIVDYNTFEQSIFEAQSKLFQAPKNVCRLCVCPYGDQYKSLCNNTNDDVYQITFKYMHSVISRPDGQNVQNLCAICMKCWDHLQKFHKFQDNIYEAQKRLPIDEVTPHYVIVKIEEQIIPPMANQICAFQTTEEHVSINANIYAMPNVQVKSEPIDQSKDIASEISRKDILHQSKLFSDSEHVRVKSEVDNITYQRSFIETPGGFKNTSYYQDSFTLPKLEIMDATINGDYNQPIPDFPIAKSDVQVKSEPVDLLNHKTGDQRNTEEIPSAFEDAVYNQASITVPKLEILDVPSDGNYSYSSDESSGEEKETDRKQFQSSKSKTKKLSRTKKKEVDELIAQWRPNLECAVCCGSFTKFTLLLQHFRRQHANSEFHIVCCQRKFSVRHMIVEHAKIHLDADAYACNICGKRLNSRTSLNSHKRKQHSNKNETKNERNTNSVTKRAHKKTFREMDDFIAQWRSSLECELCGESVVGYTAYKHHYQREHPEDKCVITCCRSKLKCFSELAKHIGIHIDPTSNTCDICQRSYSTPACLKYHKKTVHDATRFKKIDYKRSAQKITENIQMPEYDTSDYDISFSD